MAYLEQGNLRLYYEDAGSGDAILANHGLSEDTGYWSDTGVTGALSERYRVVSFDMRGHGRTVVEGEAKGYDEVTMGDDISRLADHLGLDRFHLLSHATGGMVAARYGIRHSDRLLSLMLTDTGSETQPAMYRPDGTRLTLEEWGMDLAAAAARRAQDPNPQPPSLEQRRAAWHADPDVFTFKMEQHPDSDRLYEVIEGFFQRRVNQEALGAFMASFYNDPDPMAEGLRSISCPTLILLGEHDLVFLEPSELMAREIPDNRHVVMPDVGHMTAIENPQNTIRELLDFLECVDSHGKANP